MSEKIDFALLPKLLTIEQVSEILGVHPNTLRNWDKTGRLKAVRLGVRRDRRYEKTAVEKLYLSLNPWPAPGRTPPEAEVSYVLKPGFSLRWLHLFLISKRFSVFVYSAALFAIAVAIMQVGFFAYVYRVRAEEKKLQIYQYQIEPLGVSGWEGATQAQYIDLLPNSDAASFNDKNSAVYRNQPLSGTTGITTDNLGLASADQKFEATGFVVPKDSPPGGTLKKANVIISLAADSFAGNDDVVDVSYSIERGGSGSLASISLDSSTSNAINNGFWSFPLDISNIKLEDLATLHVYANYNAVPGKEAATAYLDGVQLQISVEEPASVVQQIEQSVAIAKDDFKANEEPVISVETEDKKLLGIGTKRRTIKEVHITDPAGKEVKQDNLEAKNITEGKITKKEYTIDTTELNRPGQYTISITIEQDGQTKTVTRDFTWGVLVINTMKSVYRPGETVKTGMGVLDSGGHTICDAQLVMNMTAPDGSKQTFTTKDGTITYSTECGPFTVTNIPDYAAEFVAEKTGDYQLQLTATTAAGDYMINETVHVQNDIAFDITRLGPTRVYPRENYQMFLEVTPAADYTGAFEEYVPLDFEVPRVDQDGLASNFDATRKAISWIVDWKAGQSYTLSYEMDPPNVSPEIFLLGPAKAGTFTEARQWQIASDATCTSAASGNWNAGATWTGCGLNGPIAGDSVVIKAGHMITIPTLTAAAAADITIGGNSSATQNGITFATNSSSLAISAGISMAAASNASDSLLAVDAGTLSTSSGTTTLAIAGSATLGQASIFRISTGSATFTGAATFSGTAAQAQLTFTGGGTLSVLTLGTGGTFTKSTGTLKLTNANAFNLTNYTYHSLQIAGSNTVTTQQDTSLSGNLTVTSGTFVSGANYSLTVTGNTSVTGSLTNVAGATGTYTFTGTVTVNSGGTFNPSTAAHATVFANNITIASGATTFNTGTGAITFQTNAIAIAQNANITATFGGAATANIGVTFSGAYPITFSSTFAIGSGRTMINNNTNAAGVTITGNLTGADGTSIWSNGLNTANSVATFTAGVLTTGVMTPSTSNANTVIYNGAGQTIKNPSANYYHLILSGSGTDVLPGALTTTGNFTVSGTVTTSLAGNLIVGGILTHSGTSLTVGSTYTISVTGVTNISSSFVISASANSETFTGLVTLQASATWNDSGNRTVTFKGGLTNDSANVHTFGTGVQTFDTNDQNIGGTYAISIPSVTSGTAAKTLTNTGTLTITTALAGGGNFTNTSNLHLDFTGAITLSGTFTASANPNLVDYGYNGAQTVAAVTYHNLTLSTGGTKTITSVATVNGNLTMTGTSTTATTNALATVGGNIDLSGTSTLTLGTVALVTVTGDITVATGCTLADNVSTTVNGGDVTVTSTGAITSSGGTLTVAGGGATGITGNGNITLTNLATSGSGTVIYSASGTNTINTNVTVAASTTLDIRSTMAITGSIINTTTGIIDTTTGTPTVTVSGTTIGGGTGAITFYNLTKTGVGSTTWTNSSGGNTIDNDLTISAGTFVAPAGTLNIGGSFANSATFTHSSGTLNFNATAAGHTIAVNASQLNNVTLNGVSGGWSFTAATTTLAGDLTVTAGTLSGTTNIIVNGSDLVCGASCGTITLTGGTVTLVGTGNLGTALLSTTWTFASLSFGDGTAKTTTAQGTGTITITGVLTLNSKHILDAGAKTWVLSGTGTPFVDGGGTLTGSASTFKYTGAGATNITPQSYTNLEILPGAVAATHTMKSGTFLIGGDLTLGDGTYLGTTITAGGIENPAISLVGNLVLCASPCTNPGTFTKSSGAFTWRPSGTKTWTDNNLAKQNIGTVSITVGSSTPKIQLATAAAATSIAVAASHELQLNSKDLTLTGALTTATTGSITCASCNAGTVTARTTLGGGSGGITFYNLTLSTTTTLSSSFTVMNDLTLPASVTAGSTTVTMTGATGTIVGGGATLNNLTISGTTISLTSSDLTVSGTLTVDSGDELSLDASRTVTYTGSGDIAGTGNITGTGTLRFTDISGGPGTTITTLSAPVRYDATGGNILVGTFDARTYGGNVEAYSNVAAVRSIAMATGTQTFSGNLTVTTGASQSSVLTLDASANPAVALAGNLAYSMGGSATPAITSGTGTWTVSGDVTMTNGTFTATAGNKIIMNAGTDKTLTSNGQVLYDLTLSGHVILANATHTISNDLDMTGGTITAGTSTIAMTGTTNAITGGGATLNNLTIDPATAGTITLSTSNLTVSGALTVASGDALSIDTSRILTDTGSADIAGTGDITGAGTLKFTNTSGGPGTTITTLSVPVQYDATNGDIAATTVDVRTYGNSITFYDTSSSSQRTITLASGTYALAGASSHFYVNAGPGADLTVIGATNNSEVTIGGSLDFTGTGTQTITSGTNVWIVSGSVDFTGGTFTATAGNTLKMNGASNTITSASQTLQNFEVTGGSITTVGATDVNGTFTVSAGTFTQAANNDLHVAGNFTLASSTTFTKASGTGAIIFDGDQTFEDQNATKQDMGAVEIGLSPDTTDMKSDMAAASLLVKALDRLNTHGYDLDIGGNVTVAGILDTTDSGTPHEGDTTMINLTGSLDLQAGATFTQADSTVTFDGTSGTSNLITNGAFSLYNLVVNDGGLGLGLTVMIEDALDVDNNLTITGGTLDAKTGENNAINVGGSWSNSDIFTARSGTVTFDSTAAGKTINVGSSAFYNLIFDGSGGGWTLSTNNVTVSNDLTVTNGTVGGTVNVGVSGGDIVCGATCGTINFTGGKVTLSGTGNFGTTALASNWTFYDFTFSGTTTSQGTGTITVTDALEIGGTRSLDAGAKTWVLSGTGTPFTISGTLTGSTSTFKYTGIGSTTITASANYNNLEILPGGNMVTHTLAAGTFTLSGDLTLGNGVSTSTGVNASTYNPVINVAGNLVVCASPCSNQVIYSKSSGALTLKPSGTKTWTDNNATKQDVGGVKLQSGASTPVIQLSTGVLATSLDIATGHGLNLNDNDLYLTGASLITAGTGSIICSGAVSCSAGTVTIATGSGTFGGGSGGVEVYNITFGGTGTTIASDFSVEHTLTLPSSITAGIKTVTMNRNGGTIVGGGATLYNLTIDPLTAGTVTLNTSDLTISNALSVATGDILSISSGRTLTVAKGITLDGTISGAGRLTYQYSDPFPTTGAITSILRFDATAANQTMSARTYGGRVEIFNSDNVSDRTVTGAVGTITMSSSYESSVSGSRYVQLDLNTNDPTVSISGAVTIGSNTKLLASSANSLSIGGNYTNNDTFTHNSGTVILNGASQQTLSGTMVVTSPFNNLTITNNSGTDPDTSPSVIFADFARTDGTLTATTANTKLRFSTGSYEFTNIVLNGQATGTRVYLRSATPATWYTFTSGGTQSVSYVNVQDAYSCGGDVIDASDGTNVNAGHNSCWLFGVTVSGTVYSDEGSTPYNCSLDNLTIGVTVNGAATRTTTCTASNGTYSITASDPSAAGDPVVAFIDSAETPKATTVTLAVDTTSSITGLHLYQDRVIVRHGAAVGPITNALLATGDNGNAGIRYGVATNNLTTESGMELHVWTGDTYDPGGTITTNATGGNMHLDDSALAYIDTNTNSIGGDISVDTGATLSIDSGREITLTSTKALTLNGTISGAGRFIYTSGTAFPATGTISAILRFDTTMVFDQTMSARTYGGQVEIYNNSAGDYSTVTMAAGAYTFSSNLYLMAENLDGATLNGFSNNPTVTIAGDVDYTGAGGGEEIATGTGTWTVGGNVDFTGGTFAATAGNTFQMNGATKTITSAGQSFKNFTVTGGGISNVDALDVNGNFTVTGGGFTQGANINLNVNGNFSLSSGITFTAASGTGQLIFDGTTSYTDSTSPQQGVGVVSINGLTPATFNLASDIEATSLSVVATNSMYTNGYDPSIHRDITINGTFDATDDVETDETFISLDGNLSINAGATFVQDQSTVTFNGSSSTANLITDGAFSLYNLVIDASGASYIVMVEDPLDVDNNVTITGGTLDVKTGENNQINVGGNWLNNDIFTARSGTVVFDSTAIGKTINPGSSSFYNVTFDGSGGAWSPLTNTVTVSNDLIMTNGTFDTSNGTANVTVSGHVQCGASCGTINMTNGNTFKQSVSANKNFGTNVAVATDWTFYNLTLESSSGGPTITINGTGTGKINVLHNLITQKVAIGLTVDDETNDRIFDIDGSVTIGLGSIFQASSTAAFTVGGDWTNNFRFIAGTGTVTLDGTSAQTLSGQMTGSLARFNNLVVTNAGAANPDIIFAANAETAGTFTAATANTQLQFLAGGTYTFQNISFNGQATASRLTLRSSTDMTQWNLNVAGTRSVLNTDVRDSNACGQAPDIDATAISNKNSGHNDCWDFQGLVFSISANSINLGNLSSSAVNTASLTIETITAADTGYATFVYDDGNLRNGANDINDVADGAVTAGSEEYGIATSDASQAISQDTDCSGVPYTASPLSATQQTIAGAGSGPVDETSTICFAASVDTTMPAGTYAHVVTLVTTGLF